MESGSDRDNGNERERGERAVIEADKVRNRIRGRGFGRRCRRGVTGTTSASSAVLMLGKGNVRPCDVFGVAGMLLVSQGPDSDGAQDVVELERAWAFPYPGSTSSRGSGTSESGVKGPGVDKGESSDSDGGNGERERRFATKRSVGDEDSGLKSASNESRSSMSPCTSIPTPLSSSSSSSSFASSSSMALVQYLLVATTPSPSSILTCPAARVAMRAYTICFIIFFLATRRSTICALRSRARVHVHWHAFVLAVVIAGIRLADEEVGVGMFAMLGLGLGLGLGFMHMMRSRMERKRLRARSQMVRRCRQRNRKSVAIMLSIRYRVGGLGT